jgi:hypothetical protein
VDFVDNLEGFAEILEDSVENLACSSYPSCGLEEGALGHQHIALGD